MKKLFALALCIAMVLALVACGAAPAAETPKAADSAPAESNYTATLKMGYAGNDETTTSKYMVKWSEAVKEATNGRIVIETYSSGQLGTGVEMIEAIDLGTLDLNLADYSLMETYLPEIGLLSLPCIISDYDHMWEVYGGEVGQELFSRLQANSNIKILGSLYNGFRYIGSVRPLETLADCEGLVIRSPESDIYVNTFTLYGMNPTPLPLGDVYSALQTGVVEGVDSPIENFVNFSFGEVAPYILKSRHLASSLPIVINKGIWDSIPAADQEILVSTLASIIEECNQAVLANEQASFDTLTAAGVTFTEFSAAEREALVARFTDYWSTFAKEKNCEDLLEKLMATM